MATTRAILHADMSRCRPATALGRAQRPGGWFLVDYETEEGDRGVMMYADSRGAPPAVTLALGARGWHRIFVGVNYTRSTLVDPAHLTPWTMWGSLRIRLTGDATWRRIAHEQPWRHAAGCYQNPMGSEKTAWESVYEVHWRCADLTDQDITFAPPPPGPDSEAAITNVAWVRLEPMSAADIEAHRRDRPRPDTRRLAGAYCLGQLSGHTYGNPMYRPTDRDYVTEMIEPFRDSDFRLLLWECIRGDICLFRTRIGRVGWTGEAWDERWIDPLAVAVEHARDCGVELYASMRMIGPGYPFKLSPLQQNAYYYANRRYALRDEEGRPTSILSLAWPEVRAHWVALLREAVAYGADGVHLNLHRANPFALYEAPCAEPFERRHGVDPRTLPYDDERWLRHRAGFVTQFLREVRAMLDEQQQQRRSRRRLGVAVTFWRQPTPLYHALDLETLVRERLVDYLMPQWIHLATDDGPAIVRDLKRFTAGSAARLWPDIFPRTMPGETYAEKLGPMYAAGADGFAFWSAELRTPRASEWSVVRRLGHVEELDRYRREAPTYRRRVPLRELGGISMHHSHTDG